MIRSTDAIIIGGGPAGSMAAIRLCRLGWQVVLVEKGERHRSKACGGCLSPKGVALLREAGLADQVNRIALGTTRRFHVQHERGREWSLSLADHASAETGLIVSRNAFDQMLLDHALESGAHIMQPARAEIVSCDANESVVRIVSDGTEQDWKTPLLIGADGLRSGVATRLGFERRQRAGRNTGFAFELSSQAAATFDGDTIEMFVGARGYLGLVTVGGGNLHLAGLMNPGMGGRLKRNRMTPLGFCRAMADSFEALRRIDLDRVSREHVRHLRGAGPMPCRPRCVADEKGVLVGDAAGYVEPFTGEGMACALESAGQLGTVLDSTGPGLWNELLARRYRQAWKRQIETRLRRCAALGGVVHRPWLFDALLRFCPQGGSVARHLARRVVAT